MFYKMVETINWLYCNNYLHRTWCPSSVLYWQKYLGTKWKRKIVKRKFYASLLLLMNHYHKWRLVKTKVHFHHFHIVIITVMTVHFLNKEKFPSLNYLPYYSVGYEIYFGCISIDITILAIIFSTFFRLIRTKVRIILIP